MFQQWWLEFQLGRVERKLRRAHALQREVRQRMSDLEAEHRKGGLAKDRYEQEIERLEARRSELTREVSELNAREASLKRELGGAQA